MSASNKYEWDYCTLSPEKVFGVYIGKPCCSTHDGDYCLEGNIKTQLEADTRFRVCIAESFLAHQKPMWQALLVSGIYYRAVRLFGWYEWKTWSAKGPQPSKKERWLQRWKNINGRGRTDFYENN